MVPWVDCYKLCMYNRIPIATTKIIFTKRFTQKHYRQIKILLWKLFSYLRGSQKKRKQREQKEKYKMSKSSNNMTIILSNVIKIVAAAKSLQSCLTLCDPIDSSPPGSPVPRILQARTLEWVAISFSNAWKWKVKLKSLSRVPPSATSWTAAFQAPPSMGFSRQEYWSGMPLPSPNKDC